MKPEFDQAFQFKQLELFFEEMEKEREKRQSAPPRPPVKKGDLPPWPRHMRFD